MKKKSEKRTLFFVVLQTYVTLYIGITDRVGTLLNLITEYLLYKNLENDFVSIIAESLNSCKNPE